MRIFLLVMFYLCIHGSTANIECRNTEQCTCLSGQNEEYEYQCPPNYAEEGGVVMHLRERDEIMEIDCYSMDTLNLDVFPAINASVITRINMRFCPLPKNNFGEVFSKFMITQPQTFQFRFSNLSGISLSKDYFKGLSSLKGLALRANQLQYLDEDVFANTPNLENLDLKENKIHLKPNTFNFTPNLNLLDISGNGLKTLPVGLFHGLKKLNVLHMWSNKLTRLDEATFAGLDNLTSLELTVNKISSIAENTFENLTKLVNLSLSINQLTDLPRGLFSKNKMLEQVRMEHNPRLVLPDYAFADLPSLKEIRLFNCNLMQLPVNLLNGSTSLRIIKLDQNRLRVLPEDFFKSFQELREIHLSKNGLEVMPNFYGLKKLEKLNLNQNSLRRIDRRSFRDLTRLLELNLGQNRIEYIDDFAFSNNENLIKLSLAHNRYDFNITGSTFMTTPFTNCINLEEINLSNNLITSIPEDLTYNKVRLQMLDLSHNAIDNLQFLSLQTVAGEKVTIYLGHNNISSIEFNLAKSKIVARQNAPLDAYSANKVSTSVVFLENNPIKCDCHIYDLVRYFRNELDPSLRVLIELKPDGLICAGPDDHKDNEVEQLLPQLLACPLDELVEDYRCPEGCWCSWKPHDKKIVYNCAFNNLSQAPEINLPQMEQYLYNQTQVLLQGNHLRKGPARGLKGWDNVTELYLSQNTIRNITWVPPKLEVLMLDNNNLSRIPNNVLQSLNSSSLRHFSLDNNPWICDCNAQNLTNFIRQHSRLIETKDVRCIDPPHSLLVDLNKHNLCKEWQPVYLALAIVLILLITAILAALYYRHQEDIKVWLYAKNLCLWWVTEEELDKNKKFDAFISFSHKDEDFVAKKLLPVLEGGPNPYKLCIHVRDWIGGELIADQVIRSVNNSRRTIVVLSSNFLESVWGKMEFKTAHTQAMSEGRARVIVILLGDIDMKNLDEDLKSYLRTNTYVKWDEHDPWFWNKLRYALPHSKRNNGSQKLANMMTKIDDKFSLVQPVSTPDAGSTPPVLTLDASLFPLKFTSDEPQV